MQWPRLLAILAVWDQSAQTATEDPKALLLEVRNKVMLTLSRLPKYLCTETVNRSMLRPVEPFTGSSCDDLASARRIRKPVLFFCTKLPASGSGSTISLGADLARSVK
jgi:hypothetical protein